MTTESHDDFKPQSKAQPDGAMQSIQEDVNKHDVLLYMKARSAVVLVLSCSVEWRPL